MSAYGGPRTADVERAERRDDQERGWEDQPRRPQTTTTRPAPLPSRCIYRYRAVRPTGTVYPVCGEFMSDGVCPTHGDAWRTGEVPS